MFRMWHHNCRTDMNASARMWVRNAYRPLKVQDHFAYCRQYLTPHCEGSRYVTTQTKLRDSLIVFQFSCRKAAYSLLFQLVPIAIDSVEPWIFFRVSYVSGFLFPVWEEPDHAFKNG